MSKKSYIFLLIIISTIFTSYNYLNPLSNGAKNLHKDDYSLKTFNINKDNKWSKFKDAGKGIFFIHPGEKKARGVFIFKKDGNYLLDFSIRKGSTVGDLEFTIKKNNKEINKSIVTVTQTNKINIKIANGDTIEIIADEYGKTSADWANLEIKVQETSFALKNSIIPFLWAILFIFLFGKGHIYIAINSYIIFMLILFAEKLNFGALNFSNTMTYMLLLFTLTFMFTFVYQEFTRLKKFRIASILSFISALMVYTIPLFFIIYALNSDHKVTKDILYAVFQSNSTESYEYVSDFISMKYILMFIVVTLVIGTLLYRQEKKETLKIEKSLLIFITITFLGISSTQFSQLRLPKFIIDGFEKYDKELKLFREVQKKRKSGEITFGASKETKGETYIIVIGESLNKKHMGIYGYLRDTTPLLSKMNTSGELTVFNNAYANHTHTVPVLSLSLTEANQYNKKTYYDSLSIIEILKKADIETFWLTNQTIYGVWDNMVSVLASSSDHLVALNKSIGTQTKTQQYDGALIDEVKKVLAEKTDKNRVIFVHLIGNHGSYASRYPKDTYSIYKDKLKLGEFGTKASKNDKINPYDNSVVYNDYVVSSILEEFQKEKGVNGFLYMSDHTDDVIRKLGHESSRFTYEMTQIPMIAWFSDDYKKEYNNKYDTLLSHKNTLFSNDMLYDTMIGLFDIKTDNYNVKYDFSSKDYTLDPKDALVLHGKKHYTDKSNYIYWQKVNTQYLVDSNQSSRVFPHRVDSIGKLKDIWNDGFRSLELDARFGDNNTTFFQMGHNHGVMGLKMEEFLLSVDYSEIGRVWLDFKNLNQSNYREAIKRLEYLDRKYGVKKKFIVESSTTAPFFKEVRKTGWHTSYYMPTGKIVKLLKDKDITEMNKLAKIIATQTKLQNVSAVSFDNRLYPFVKQYLEPLIDKDVVYHIWYAPSLSSSSFQQELQKSTLYLDKRVKTLLTSYKSQFNL